MRNPLVGDRFRLPSHSVVLVTRTFAEVPKVGCRYIEAAWHQKRKGVRRIDGDLMLSVDFIRRYAQPIGAP